MSSPETDTSLSSPTSVSTYSAVSPVLPIHPDLGQFSSSLSPSIPLSVGDRFLSEPKLESMAMNTPGLREPAIRSTEPSWLRDQYLSGIPPLSPTSQMPVHGGGRANEDGSTTPKSHTTSRRHSASLSSYLTPLHSWSGMRTNPSSGPERTINSLGEQTSFTFPQGTSPTVDDGDRPFIFNAEYEAATAARMEEVLQSSSNLHYSMLSTRNRRFMSPFALPIRQNSYPPTVQPQQPTSPTMEIGYRSNHPESNAMIPEKTPSSHKRMSETYNTGSSSLNGWAG